MQRADIERRRADILRRIDHKRRADIAAAGADDVEIEEAAAYLYDPETPDPDLVIRTAGEMPVSNFLLWQFSYAELYTTPCCWPDFRREELLKAMTDFAGRRRKYGGLQEEGAGVARPESPGETA